MPGDGNTKRAVLESVNTTDRRGVLGSLAAGLAGAVGLAGTVAARPAERSDLTPAAVQSSLDSDETVRAAIEASGVLESVSGVSASAVASLDREVIDFEARDQLAGIGNVSPDALAGSYLLTAGVVDGELTPQVLASVPVEGGTLVVSVFPAHEDGYVRLNTGGDSTELVSADVTTQDGCPSCCGVCPYDACFDCYDCLEYYC